MLSIKEISARQIIRDIRAGIDDVGLMRKYEITKRQLKALLHQLSEAGVVDHIQRITLDLSLKELIADIRAGIRSASLQDKYRLTVEELWGVCQRLLHMGLVSQLDLEGRPDFNKEFVVPDESEHCGNSGPQISVDSEPGEPLPAFLYFPNSVLRLLREDPDELERALNRRMNPNARDRHFRRPALCWASGYGNIAAVRMLINKGAHLEATGKDRKTALFLATSRNHAAVREFLISHGATD